VGREKVASVELFNVYRTLFCCSEDGGVEVITHAEFIVVVDGYGGWRQRASHSAGRGGRCYRDGPWTPSLEVLLQRPREFNHYL